MKREEQEVLTTVKAGRLIRHPLLLVVAGVALAGLAGLNITAFVLGLQAPWLLGLAIITDMLAIGGAILAAARWLTETERARDALGEAQARLGAILDSAMDAVVTVDETHRVVLFNRAAEQVFGVPREQALGASLDRFLPARFRGAHHGHIQNFERTGVTSRRMGDMTTLWAQRADGSEFP